MDDEAHFELIPGVLARYRALRFDPTATRDGNIVPLESPFWSDEHDFTGTEFPLGNVRDDTSRYSIMMLVAARNDLWRYGEIRPELRGVWEEAREQMPDWPGFRRLTADQELLDFLDELQGLADEFEAAMLEGADEVEIEERPGGVQHVRARHDLTKNDDG